MNPNLIVLKKGHIRFLSDRKTTRENFKIGVNSTYILTLLFIGFLGIYYVLILNINATKGYSIRNLEIEKNKLIVEKEIIDVKIAEMESLSTLMKWDGIKNMEKNENPEFIVVKNMESYAFKN